MLVAAHPKVARVDIKNHQFFLGAKKTRTKPDIVMNTTNIFINRQKQLAADSK